MVGHRSARNPLYSCGAWFLAAALIVTAGFPARTNAQVQALDEAFAKMDPKLPKRLWDGKTLHVDNWDQLMEVELFLWTYSIALKDAQKAFNNLSADEQTEARKAKLEEYAAWSKPAEAAFNEKAKKIKRPSFLMGPDVGKGKPFILDTVGEQQTRVSLRSHTGPHKGGKQSPPRYDLSAEFLVHFDGMAPEDLVVLQPMKGKKKLGPPRTCKVKPLGTLSLGRVECQTFGPGPEYKDLYSVPGDVEIKLTYRQALEGKDIKNFDSLLARVIKEPVPGGSFKWSLDYDMDLGASTIQERAEHVRGWGIGASTKRVYGTRLFIHTMVKNNRRGGENFELACMHDGKRVFGATKGGGGWSHSVESKSGGPTSWRPVTFRLKTITRLDPEDTRTPDWYYLSEHPGEYKCVMMVDGAPTKEFYFTADSTGYIVKPECQEASMNSPREVTLLTTKQRKPYPVKWDKKLAAKRGYGGGVTWTAGCPPTK